MLFVLRLSSRCYLCLMYHPAVCANQLSKYCTASNAGSMAIYHPPKMSLHVQFSTDLLSHNSLYTLCCCLQVVFYRTMLCRAQRSFICYRQKALSFCHNVYGLTYGHNFNRQDRARDIIARQEKQSQSTRMCLSRCLIFLLY